MSGEWCVQLFKHPQWLGNLWNAAVVQMDKCLAEHAITMTELWKRLKDARAQIVSEFDALGYPL
jgi:hypothetical protein